MNQPPQGHTPPKSRFTYPLFVATVLTMALTGFGQMPIYKRYYLADIPGMTWLADFYITRYIHYIGAAILLGLMAYIVIDHFLSFRNHRRMTAIGMISAFLMTGIVITGIFFTIKNFPDVFFTTGIVHLINLGHLGFAMLFLGLFFIMLIFRKKWVLSR